MILGASFDTPAENKAFADTEGFGYRLLSDVDRAVGRRYEAARPGGQPFGGLALRVAYLIDPAGTIAKSYRVGDVGRFASEVLADLEILQQDGRR